MIIEIAPFQVIDVLTLTRFPWDRFSTNEIFVVTCRLDEPIQIRLTSLGNRQTNHLGDFVGVVLEDGGFEFLVKRGAGFNKDKDFFGGFFPALPAVMGFETGKELHAGGEAPGN